MRPLLPLSLLLAVPLVGPAHAKKPDAPTVAKVPSIEEVVAAEGFVPTPSQSEIYRPGAVLVPNGRGGHDVVVEACIDVEPSISIMSQSSIATTLAGGVSARLGVARGAASAGVEKRLSFVDPEQRTIPLARLLPTEACTKGVKTAAAYQDLSDAIVLHDVLVAIIKNTVCTKADASGGVVALGAAEAAAYSECVQESDGQVPLGYKAVPLDKVLSLAGSSAASPIAPPAAPVTPSTPSAASASVDFGGMGSVDVDARLKAQACEQAAQREGAAARQARLDAAAADVQAQASTAWQGMEASLRKCTQLPRADRADCVAMADKWLGAARAMTVSLDAGVETVQTDCGTRQPAFAAASQTVSAREVAAAEALLAQLKAADAAVASSGGGGGAVAAAGIEWVSLGAFEISKTEVTVAQYRACVRAGACTEPKKGTTNNWGVSGRDNHPINGVDWKQATTFAEWAGGRLPTGEEWTYAATSGGQSWDYPWGDETATCDRAIMDDGGSGCGQGHTWPVCSKPAGHSKQGVCDLAGNVAEWTDELEQGHLRMGRGGGWGYPATHLRASHRSAFGPSSSGGNLGFRLVR
jgi:formylglycine-generating enzyme required for sulfatase activity